MMSGHTMDIYCFNWLPDLKIRMNMPGHLAYLKFVLYL